MKIKSLAIGLMLVGSLTMVGCEDIKDTGDVIDKENTKVEEVGGEEDKQLTLEEAEKLVKDLYKKYGVEKEVIPNGNNNGITEDGQYYMFIVGHDVWAPEVDELVKVNINTGEMIYVPKSSGSEVKPERPLEDVLKERYADTKKEDKKEEKATSVEKGQCYDCGEYYPVSQMTFNGRSYHCGCVACELCGERMPKDKVRYVDGTPMCKACEDWHNEENAQWEKEQEQETSNGNDDFDAPVCLDCGVNESYYAESGLCKQCAQNYSRCSVCGDMTHNDDLVNGMCEYCSGN